MSFLRPPFDLPDLEPVFDRSPLIVAPDTPLPQVVERMRSRHCPLTASHLHDADHMHCSSYALVMADGELLGIFTERNVVDLTAQGADIANCAMTDVMTRSPLAVRQTDLTDCFRVLDLLRQHQLHHLPVLDEQGHLLGIITADQLRRHIQPAHLLRLRHVNEIMQTSVVQAPPQTPLRELARRMASHRVSCVVLMEATAGIPRPVGIVTQRDVVQFQALALDLERLPAASIMSTPLFHVSPDATLWHAHEQMRQHRLRRLVVTGINGELLGLVTLGDILQTLNPLELYRTVETLQHQLAETTTALEWEAQQRTQQEDLFTRVFRACPDAIAITTLAEGRFIEVNDNYVELLGYRRDELIGRTSLELGLWQDAAARTVLVEQLQRDRAIHDWEITCQTKRGDRRTLLFSAELVALRGETCVVGVTKDITAQKQLEQAQQQSENQLAAMLDSAIAAIVRLRVFANHDWYPEYCSAGCAAVYGYTAEEFMRQPQLWLDRIHPDDLENVIQPAFAVVLAEGQTTDEFRFQHKDGTWRWISRTFTSQRDPVADNWLVTLVAIDVTDRKQMETNLRDQQQWTERLLHASPQFIYLFEFPSERNLYVSPQIETILGYRPDQIGHAGITFYETMHPDDRPQFEGYRDRAMALADGDYIEIEFRQRHANGEYRWIRSRDVVFERDASGQPTKFLGTALDVTDRKTATLALRQQEQEFRTLTENSPDVIVRLDRAHRYRYVNPTIERATGIPAERWIGRTAAEMELPNNLTTIWDELLQGVFATGEPCEFDFEFSSPEQPTYWFSRLVPEFAADGTVASVLCIGRDITERRAQEEELRRYERIIASTPDEVALVDEHYRYRLINDAYLDWQQKPREAIVGHTVSEVLGETAFQTKVKPVFDRCLQGETVRYENWFAYENGTRQRYVSVTYAPYVGRDGQIRGVVANIRDRTDLQQATEELRQRQAFIQQITDNSPQLLYIYDLREQRNVYINRQIAPILGYTPDEIQALGTDLFAQLWHPEDLAHVPAAIAALGQMADGDVVTLEYRMRHKAGHWIWLQSREVVFERDATGELVKVLGTAVEITDRKQLEAERQAYLGLLQEQEAMLRAIADNLPGAVYAYVQEPDGTVAFDYISSGCEALIGLSAETLMADAQAFYQRIHPDEAAAFQAAVEASARSLSPFYFEWRQMLPDGSVKWIASISKPELRVDGSLIWRGVAIDISDRKQAEQALRDSEAKFAAIFKTSPDPITIWDIDQDCYREVNASFCDLIGYAADEILAAQATTLPIWVDPNLRTAVLEALQTAPDCTYEAELRTRTGEIRSCLVSATLLEIGSERWLLNIFKDITYRKATEQALQESEIRFRHLAANIPGAIFRYILYADGGDAVAYMSPGCQRLWEVDAAQVEADAGCLWDRVHPDDVHAMRESVAESALTLQPWWFEWRIVTASGRLKWVQGTGRPTRHANGDVVWDSMVLDVTDRRQAERSLRESESRKQAILNAIPALITLFDHQGICLEVVKSNDLIDLVPPEVERVGRSLTDFLPLELATQQLGMIQRAIATGQIQTVEQQVTIGDRLQYEEVQAIPMAGERALLMVRNISDRKQAELDLQVSQKKLNLALQAAKLGSWQWNLVTNELICSDQCKLNAGLTPADDLDCERLFTLIHPDDRERVAVAMQTAIDQHQDYRAEYRMQWTDGTVQWLLAFGRPSYADDGTPLHLDGITLNITDRKQTELALRESEARFQEIARTIHQVFFVRAADSGQFLYVSPAYETIWGHPCDTLYQDPNSWLQLVHPSDRAWVEQTLREQFNGVPVTREYRIVRPDGAIRWIFTQVEIIRDAAGQPIRQIGTAIDVTERKQTEAALQRYERVVSATSDGIVLIAPDYTYQLTNQAYCDRFVPPGKALQGHTVADLVGHEFFQSVLRNRLDCALAGETIQVENWYTFPESGPQFVSVTYAPYVDTDGTITGVVASLRDLTELKAIEEALRESLQEKEVLLAEIHHRVKNNLQVVSSLLYLQLLRTVDTDIRQALEEIASRVRSMALVHESLYQTQNFAAMNFDRYVRSLSRQLLHTYRQAAIATQLDIQIDPTVIINLEQAIPCGLILNELITNTLKYGAWQGQCQVHIWMHPLPSARLELVVGNDGDTLPADFSLDHHFESMGMQLVLTLTEQLDGTLTLERGDRTLFRISFPQANRP